MKKHNVITGDMKTEKVKIINNIRGIEILSDLRGRIYFGDEFCEKKMPTLKDLKYLVSRARNKKISVVFPYLTEPYLDKAKKILNYISDKDYVFDEIVFNDWGLFYYIRKNYPRMKLVLGRLLTKQKTDPFAREIILNKQKKTVCADKKILIPKKVPKNTLEYFGETLINSKIFQRFMSDNNIIRVELDNLNWDMKVKLPGKIKASLYFPYAKITTTRFCGYLNMLENNCSKQCEKLKIKLKRSVAGYDYVIKGNAVFFKNGRLPSGEYLKNNCIDRIVLND